MNPILAILFAEIIKQSPALAIELVQLLSKEKVTEADWQAAKVKWSKPYDQYIAEAQAELDAAKANKPTT